MLRGLEAARPLCKQSLHQPLPDFLRPSLRLLVGGCRKHYHIGQGVPALSQRPQLRLRLHSLHTLLDLFSPQQNLSPAPDHARHRPELALPLHLHCHYLFLLCPTSPAPHQPCHLHFFRNLLLSQSCHSLLCCRHPSNPVRPPPKHLLKPSFAQTFRNPLPTCQHELGSGDPHSALEPLFLCARLSLSRSGIAEACLQPLHLLRRLLKPGLELVRLP
mmetsp:Transcript_11070/g.26094  ORF Transcript_11070/g.26094 Transcript_11070/m.26094 type:complete len:217 (+) Transcript_11070:2010-2660(+)